MENCLAELSVSINLAVKFDMTTASLILKVVVFQQAFFLLTNIYLM